MGFITMGMGKGGGMVCAGMGATVSAPAPAAASSSAGGGAGELIEIIEEPLYKQGQETLTNIILTEVPRDQKVNYEYVNWLEVAQTDLHEDLLGEIKLDYEERIADLRTQLRTEKLKVSKLQAQHALTKIHNEYNKEIYSYIISRLKHTPSFKLRRIRVIKYWQEIRQKHKKRYYIARSKLKTGMISKKTMQFALKHGLIHNKYLSAKSDLFRYVNFTKLYELSKPKPKHKKRNRKLTTRRLW